MDPQSVVGHGHSLCNPNKKLPLTLHYATSHISVNVRAALVTPFVQSPFVWERVIIPQALESFEVLVFAVEHQCEIVAGESLAVKEADLFRIPALRELRCFPTFPFVHKRFF